MSSSTITYTSISSDSDLPSWGFHLMDPTEFEAPEEAPQSPEQTPPSPDYVPGPEYPPSPDYVPGPEYLGYVAPADDEISVEDQPLPVNASPIALSLGYIADSDPSKDPKEDLVDYLADGGDDDEEEEEEESSKDDDDDEEEEEAFEEDEEEKEHIALTDSAALPVTDLVPSPRTKVPFSQTRLRMAWKTIRLQPSMTVSTKALIAEFASPTPPSPPPSPSPLSPWSYPLP
ncbi:hypothetical protein Tco_0488152 [Tanacetum coccineum]